MQFGRRAGADFEVAKRLEVGGISGRGDKKVAALGIVAAKDLQRGAVEGARVPLALDGVHFIAAVGEHEIHFATSLVAPIADGGVREVGLQVFEDEVFPERAEVLLAERVQPRAKLTKPVSKP